MTFTEAFDKIKKVFKTTDASAISVNYAVQVNFTDEDCNGAFYIAIDSGAVYVEPYDYYDRRALLAAEFKVLKDIFSGKLDVFTAIEKGVAYVEGDAMCITEIAGTVKKPVRKTATKKTAEKTVKKTTKKATKNENK